MMIAAMRGGVRREFDAAAWREMPEGKYGWMPVADVPEEVTRMQAGVAKAEVVKPLAAKKKAAPKKKTVPAKKRASK